MSDTSPDASREDPRIGRTRDAVRRATLEVLAARGYAAFTVEAVAEQARVAKSTIYRHWDGRIGLISDALEQLNRQPRVAPAEGSAREQVTVLLQHLVAAFADPVLSGCMPALADAAEHHEEVAAFLHAYSAGRRQALVDVLAAGVASGELPAHLDPDLASLTLSAPIPYCRTLTPTPFPPEQVDALVTQVLGPAG